MTNPYEPPQATEPAAAEPISIPAGNRKRNAVSGLLGLVQLGLWLIALGTGVVLVIVIGQPLYYGFVDNAVVVTTPRYMVTLLMTSAMLVVSLTAIWALGRLRRW